MDAYRRSQAYAASQKRKIIAVIDAAQKRGKYGATCDEVEIATGIAHQSCSAAFNALMNEGVIVATDITRPTRLNRGADVYRIAAIPVDPNMPRQEAMNMGQE